ncbi:MAG: hypothetical protein Ct9H300mP28_26500 [Pseudomonadota bacterium]|nr:MAG: hypothetical protein Ct9H300mP28_26500 [Pseudomonadota bacterium]
MGNFGVSNGKSSEERTLEKRDSVVSLDLCLDYNHSPRVVLAAVQIARKKVLKKQQVFFSLSANRFFD